MKNYQLFEKNITSCGFKIHLREVKVIQLDPMEYTVHGILQVRILEVVTFPFPRDSSQTRVRTQVSHIAGRFFTSWVTRESQEYWSQ